MVTWPPRRNSTGARLTIKEKLAPDSLTVAATLNSLGEVAYDRGDLAAAEELLRARARHQDETCPRQPHRRGEPEQPRGGGRQTRRPGGCRKLLPGCADPSAEACPRQHRAKRGALQSRVARATSRAQRKVAADYFERAIAALEEQTGRLGGADEVRSGFTALYIRYYREYVDLLVELDQAAHAFQVLERSRARSLLAMLAERDLVFAADLPADLARDRTAGQRGLRPHAVCDRAAESRQRQRRDRAPARRACANYATSAKRLPRRFARASPHFASLHYPQPLDLDSAQASLDTGTVLLSYCVTREKTFLFVVQPGGRPW